MKAKEQLKLMGKKVIVLFELKRKLQEDASSASPLLSWEPEKRDQPRVGWIVGFRQLLNGRKVSSNYYGDGDGDQGYIKETMKRTPAVMVSYWPTKKPVPVPETGYVLDSGDAEPTSPYTWPEGQMSERYKAELKEIMAKTPRDSKGRWKK